MLARVIVIAMWRSVVTMALSYAVFEIFDFEEYCDIEIQFMDYSWSS